MAGNDGSKIWQVTVRDTDTQTHIEEIEADSFRLESGGYLYLSWGVKTGLEGLDKAVFAPGVWLGIRVKEEG